jgi:hypothetical protein
MITEKEAVERAKERLAEIHAPYEDRKVTVSLEGDRYNVVFLPPEKMRAGKFKVTVNAETGEVLEAIIGR